MIQRPCSRCEIMSNHSQQVTLIIEDSLFGLCCDLCLIYIMCPNSVLELLGNNWYFLVDHSGRDYSCSWIASSSLPAHMADYISQPPYLLGMTIRPSSSWRNVIRSNECHFQIWLTVNVLSFSPYTCKWLWDAKERSTDGRQLDFEGLWGGHLLTKNI